MRQLSRSRSRWLPPGCTLLAVVLAAVLVPPRPAAGQGDIPEVLSRVRDLFAVSAAKRIVRPVPGSRSVILAADGTAELYLYLERGSIRGQAINEFYERYEAGDLEGAYDVFTRNSLVVLRISDYGWNGLGVPLVTETGVEIEDVFFRVERGAFRQAEVTPEDRDNYQALLREVVIPALEELAGTS